MIETGRLDLGSPEKSHLIASVFGTVSCSDRSLEWTEVADEDSQRRESLA